MCLSSSGQVLGGFGGAHSLNAWCADPSHTNGENLPDPELVNGRWECAPAGGQPTPAATATSQPPPVTVTPGQPSRSPNVRPLLVPIPLGAACKWAYPGRASGQTSGSADAIVCLSSSGHVLGGFGGAHSLNAWCADPSHTNGQNAPDPELVNGRWECGSAGGQPAPTASPTSKPAPHPSTSGHPSHSPSPSPSPSGSQVSVPIPLGAACIWAYPGQASGQTSGSGYNIVCLNSSGQVLGGFSGAHSLNAWCADPSHTNGENLPDPELVNNTTWVCTT